MVGRREPSDLDGHPGRILDLRVVTNSGSCTMRTRVNAPRQGHDERSQPIDSPVVIEHTVSSAFVRLAVVEAGDPNAPTIVLVHGYPDTKELWAPIMTDLCSRFHVLAYDVRGAGASSAPRRRSAYDYAWLGDDLKAVIDRLAPGRSVHLVGHDWGGIAGWRFAADPRFDGKLASFTTIAGPSVDQVAVSLRELRRQRRVLELMRRVYRSWYLIPMCTPGVPTLVWRLLGRGRPGFSVDTAIHGANLYRQNILGTLGRARPEPARVPVQLVVPSRDRFISPRYYESAERYAPSLRRRSIESSHWVPRNEPDQISRWIAEFVEEVERQ
jgi:pimeloyl-ACP methyl ester carboxylesterase